MKPTEPDSSAARFSRRSVLATAPAALFTLARPGVVLAEPPQGAAAARPKVAALITEFRRNSHAEVILDRILEGYGWEGRHYRPRLDLVSMYVDQFPEGDLSRERAARFENLKIYPSIAAALCAGGDTLAVDGVLIIGEHGNYPRNDKGQWLYPRYEFFEQTVDVFRANGRAVPVFNDKHLSWNWDWARKMVDTAAQMKFPFWASSSVPISWRLPSVEVPQDAELDEVVAVGNGHPDSYDYHLLETIAALVERRRGGETGVTHVQALKGEPVWRLLAAEGWAGGGCDRALFEACLCRSHLLTPAREGFNHVYPTLDDLRRMVAAPVAYRMEYADGLKATMFLLNGLVGDLTFAVRVKDQAEPISFLSYLGGGGTTQPFNFDALVWYIEQFLHTRRLPHPIERTLLATGLVAAGVDSLAVGCQRLATPHLAIRYRPNHNSTFRQA